MNQQPMHKNIESEIFRNNQKFQIAFLKPTFSTIAFPWSWGYDW